MESRLKIRVSDEQMDYLFDNLNIRYFNKIGNNDQFDILIRHPEEGDPKNLIRSTLKIFSSNA